MKKTLLIYGSYNRNEWNEILDIFKKNGVEYEDGVHIHTHGANLPDNEKDTWYFFYLKSYVTPEEEKKIRDQRDRLKRWYC